MDKYDIIVCVTAVELVARVNPLLRDGWECLGAPTGNYSQSSRQSSLWQQAMIFPDRSAPSSEKETTAVISELRKQNLTIESELERTKYHRDTMIIGLQQQNGALQTELKEAEHRRLDYQQRAERDQEELRVKHGRLLELLVTLIALARGLHDNDLHIPGCPGLNLGEHCLCVWGRLDTFLKKLDREYQEKRGAGGLLAEVAALKKESLDEAAPVACRILDCGRPVAPGSSWCHWHAGRL